MMSQLPNISRKTFTKQRRALSVRQRRQAAFLASRFLIQLAKRLPPCAKVAFYLDDFGELPTDVIARFCARLGWQAFLPITKPNQALTFAPVQLPLSKNAFKRHRLGMLEPMTHTRLPAWQMDAIICPLVAVDRQGVRLGMGGGFYDRTFANCPNTLKVAWCYEFQLVDKLPRQSWDQCVDVVITDQRLLNIG